MAVSQYSGAAACHLPKLPEHKFRLSKHLASVEDCKSAFLIYQFLKNGYLHSEVGTEPLSQTT